MQRRAFLTVAGAAALAGCSEGSSSGSGSETSDQNIKTMSFGETLTLENEFSLTASDPQVTNEIVLEEGSYKADEGNVFVLSHLLAENSGDEPETPPGSGSIALLSGQDQFRQVDVSGGEFEEPITGEQYSPSDTLHPGITVSGWMVFEVPREISSITIAVSDYEIFQFVDAAYWEGSVDASDVANVRYEGINAPESIELGETAEFQIVAENTGGSTGTFEREAVLEGPNGPYDQDGKVNFTVDADSQRSFNLTANPRSVGNATLSIAGDSAAVEIVPASVSKGSEYELPQGGSIQFQKIQLAEYYQYEGYDGEKVVSPPAGKEFLIAFYDAENNGSEEIHVPGTDSFYAIGNSERFPRASSEEYTSTTFTDPVIGEEFVNGTSISLDPGKRKNGWVLFEVDDDLSEEDISLQVDWDKGFGDQIVVNWR